MLRCASLTKTYLSGGRRLTVLKDITLRRWSPARSSPSSDPRAAARPRCSVCSPGSTAPPPAPSTSTARTSARSTKTGGRGSARDKVGFVFQSFQLIPTLTARENVQVPLELRGERVRRAGRRAARASRAWATAAITIRRSSPAASSSASRSRARSATRPKRAVRRRADRQPRRRGPAPRSST